MPDFWITRESPARQPPLFSFLTSVDEVPSAADERWRGGITTADVSNQGLDSIESPGVLEAATTNTDTTVVLADATDRITVGMYVSGVGIPAGARVAAVTDSTHIELTVAATATDASVDLTFSAAPSTRGDAKQWLPFTLRGSVIETTQAFDVDTYPRKAAEAFGFGVSEALAHELWTGELQPSNPYLAKPGVGTIDLTPGGGIGVVAGINLLCAHMTIAGRNRAGMLFAAPQTLERWMSLSSTPGSVSGGKLRISPFGHILCSDAGFPGTGISGATTAGKQWIFGLDPVVLERSPARQVPGDLKSATSRDQNTVTYSVEQDATFRHLMHRRFCIEVGM